jgi:sulfatase maturation enzyme AslB (radical SAM superfamily)
MEPTNTESVSTHTPIEWLNSDTIQNARKQLENNVWPDACNKCKINEENGIQSMRTNDKVYGPGLSHLDLRFGNSCNLSCIMCFPGSSSSLHYEHEKLLSEGKESPWGTQRFSVYNWYDEDLGDKFANLSDLREVYLTGGEPMMVKHLDKFLEKLDSSVELRFNTNGTIINPKVYEQLKRFKYVNMCFSVDGIGKVNDYIRWGSDWNTIETNIYRLAELPNIDASIGPTVQIMNALYYDELTEWASNNQFKVYDNVLMYPLYLNLKNADDIIKLQTPKFAYWHCGDSNPIEREKFIKYTQTLDSNRGCHIKDYLPQIADIYGIN